jgi:hypothetical protein
MNILYFDTYEVYFSGQKLTWYKIGSIFFNIQYQLINETRFLENLNQKNASMSLVSSIKLNPIFETSLITNGRGKILGVADFKNKITKNINSFSNLPDANNDEILVRALVSSISSDIKIYKIDGIKVLTLKNEV